MGTAVLVRLLSLLAKESNGRPSESRQSPTARAIPRRSARSPMVCSPRRTAVSIAGTGGPPATWATRNTLTSTRSIPRSGRRTSCDQPGRTFVNGASSFHPGGVNVAFCDGSVRFIKESIDCWAYEPTTGYPLGVTRNVSPWIVGPTAKIGVWQAIASCNGGEVISADAY